MRVRAPDHGRALRAMQDAVDQELAAARTGGGRASFGVDATRVARGPGGYLYRVDPPPEATLVEDAPARLSVGERAAEGRLGSVADESCLVEVEEDLGPRVLDGRLVVDNLGPLRGLRQRLTALEGVPNPPGFRFDQAELVLGTPGGRLSDAIAEASDGTGEWSYDDRAGDVLRSALRQRWAQVRTPPGSESGGILARLLDRLLALDARVLFVAPTGAAVDRTVGALCERLARAAGCGPGRCSGSGRWRRVRSGTGGGRSSSRPRSPPTCAPGWTHGSPTWTGPRAGCAGTSWTGPPARPPGMPPSWTAGWSGRWATGAAGATATSTRTRW